MRLIDADALMESAGHIYHKFLSDWRKFDELVSCIQTAPVACEWIACAQRMPPMHDLVLAHSLDEFGRHRFFICRYHSENDWVINAFGDCIRDKITHWMPLTEPEEA